MGLADEEGLHRKGARRWSMRATSTAAISPSSFYEAPAMISTTRAGYQRSGKRQGDGGCQEASDGVFRKDAEREISMKPHWRIALPTFAKETAPCATRSRVDALSLHVRHALASNAQPLRARTFPSADGKTLWLAIEIKMK